MRCYEVCLKAAGCLGDPATRTDLHCAELLQLTERHSLALHSLACLRSTATLFVITHTAPTQLPTQLPNTNVYSGSQSSESLSCRGCTSLRAMLSLLPLRVRIAQRDGLTAHQATQLWDFKVLNFVQLWGSAVGEEPYEEPEGGLLAFSIGAAG